MVDLLEKPDKKAIVFLTPSYKCDILVLSIEAGTSLHTPTSPARATERIIKMFVLTVKRKDENGVEMLGQSVVAYRDSTVVKRMATKMLKPFAEDGIKGIWHFCYDKNWRRYVQNLKSGDGTYVEIVETEPKDLESVKIREETRHSLKTSFG